MKFQDALRLVEEFKEIKDGESMSARLDKADSALKRDISSVKNIVDSNSHINLSWKEMAFADYAEFLDNFWKLKENAQELLRKKKLYDLNPNGPIAKAILLSTRVKDEKAIESAKHIVEKYTDVYNKLKEITSLIREYNSKKLGTYMNIPSVEFKIPLREEVEDVFHENNVGFNGENKKGRSRL